MAEKKVAEVVCEVPKAGCIQWNSEECIQCARCVMACAAYHEGAVAPQLSRIRWVEDNPFNGFVYPMPLFCQQCDYPECYFACPLPDQALCIDSATGTRYINREKCLGTSCGKCVEACPFEPSRISLDAELNTAIMCDLCKDRAGGPVCVEVCDRQALTFVPREERK